METPRPEPSPTVTGLISKIKASEPSELFDGIEAAPAEPTYTFVTRPHITDAPATVSQYSPLTNSINIAPTEEHGTVPATAAARKPVTESAAASDGGETPESTGQSESENGEHIPAKKRRVLRFTFLAALGISGVAAISPNVRDTGHRILDSGSKLVQSGGNSLTSILGMGEKTSRRPAEVPYSIRAFAAVKAIQGSELDAQPIAKLRVRGTYSASADKLHSFKLRRTKRSRARRVVAEPHHVTATQSGHATLAVKDIPVKFVSSHDKRKADASSKGYSLEAVIPAKGFRVTGEKLRIYRGAPHNVFDPVLTPPLMSAYDLNAARAYGEENIIDAAAKQMALTSCADTDLSTNDNITNVERSIKRLIRPAVKKHLGELTAKLATTDPKAADIIRSMPLTKVRFKTVSTAVLAKKAKMPGGNPAVPGSSDLASLLGKYGANPRTNPRGSCSIVSE